MLFDAYGTLFDVYSVALAAEQLYPGQGQALSVLWRDKQIEYTRLVTTSNHGAQYQPFWEPTRAGLRHACQRPRLDPRPETEPPLEQQQRTPRRAPGNRDRPAATPGRSRRSARC